MYSLKIWLSVLTDRKRVRDLMIYRDLCQLSIFFHLYEIQTNVSSMEPQWCDHLQFLLQYH